MVGKAGGAAFPIVGGTAFLAKLAKLFLTTPIRMGVGSTRVGESSESSLAAGLIFGLDSGVPAYGAGCISFTDFMSVRMRFGEVDMKKFAMCFH